MPKISVILTSFNHEKYIREAIDSVLIQTFTDFELIIWDDNSSDDSWNIINSYSDNRIKAFRNSETLRGIYSINKAISEIASGDYIAIHHSDDIWGKEKLEKQIKFLDQNPQFSAVFTNVLFIRENSCPFNDCSKLDTNFFLKSNRTRHEWLNYFFYYGNALAHPSVLIRKKCYLDCGFYQYGFAQIGDFDMWIRLCLKYEIYILPEKLTKHRVRDNLANASADRPENRIRSSNEYHNIWKNYLKIDTFEEMIRIFPELKKFFRPNGFEIKFLLAMAGLSKKSSNSAKFFSIELLFNLIRDREKAKEIKKLYNFDYRDLIKLTGEHDVFSIENDRKILSLHNEIAQRDNEIAQRDNEIAQRDNEIAQRDNEIAQRDQQLALVYSSLGWKLILKYRSFVDKLFPLESFRRRFYFRGLNIFLKSIKWLLIFFPLMNIKKRVLNGNFRQ